MANFARVVDGVAVDVSTDPASAFHPDLAAQFVSVPDAVAPGWRKTGKNWAAPEPVDPEPTAPAYRTLMTPIRFKAQFSVMAQVKIKRARAYVDGTDPDPASDERRGFARDVLDILFGSLDDPRLTEVDVADPAVIGGVDFVHSIDFITADEAAEIKRGVPTAAG